MNFKPKISKDLTLVCGLSLFHAVFISLFFNGFSSIFGNIFSLILLNTIGYFMVYFFDFTLNHIVGILFLWGIPLFIWIYTSIAIDQLGDSLLTPTLQSNSTTIGLCPLGILVYLYQYVEKIKIAKKEEKRIMESGGAVLTTNYYHLPTLFKISCITLVLAHVRVIVEVFK